MKTIKLFLPGIPKSKQSFKVGHIRNKKGGLVLNSKGEPIILKRPDAEVKERETSIMWDIKSQLGPKHICHDGPVGITDLRYVFPITKSLKKWQKEILANGGFLPKTTKPDLMDNLSKMIFDGMEGIAYTNDARIFISGQMLKVMGPQPGIYFNMTFFDSEEEAARHLNALHSLSPQMQMQLL